jgi:hypothetical protein
VKELYNDRPSLQYDADVYIYHLHDTSTTNQEDDESTGELSIHSDPFGGNMVHLIDADRAYDHTLEDMLLCNVHTDYDDEYASIALFSSARDGPSIYEDAIDLLATEGMGTQEIDELTEKGQPGLLNLPGSLATQGYELTPMNNEAAR